MREILFKAQRKDGKGWVFGVPTFDLKYIFNNNQCDSPDNYEIIPETICQYTGLKDKNGVKIFEWDRVKGETRNFTVIFENGMFTTSVGMYLLNGDYEIIGNIHDKPQTHE